MSLKIIHIVFVGSAILLALFFGGWCLAQGGGYTVGAVLSFAVAAALVWYGIWFWRKITTPEEAWARRRKLFRTLPVVVAAWFASEPAAWACRACYGGLGEEGVAGSFFGGGGGDGGMLNAARAGALLLLGAVFLIQIALVLFFFYLRRRARRLRTDPVPPWWSTVEEPLKS